MRVVLDTNVLLAAYGFGGVCRELTELCLSEHDVVLSEHILDEFRTHLQGKFQLGRQRANAITEHLRSAVLCVVPSPVPDGACDDPLDLPVLGTLAAAEADCMVTGDKGLLKLREYGGHPIVSPRDFLTRMPRPPRPTDP